LANRRKNPKLGAVLFFRVVSNFCKRQKECFISEEVLFFEKKNKWDKELLKLNDTEKILNIAKNGEKKKYNDRKVFFS